MSYSISIAGGQAYDTAEQAIEAENAVVEKVRAFVDELEGVTHAQVVGGNIGTHSLTPQTEPLPEPAPADETQPAAPEQPEQPPAPPAEPAPPTW